MLASNFGCVLDQTLITVSGISTYNHLCVSFIHERRNREPEPIVNTDTNQIQYDVTSSPSAGTGWA